MIGFSLSYACFCSPNLLKVSESLEPEHEPLQQSNNTHLMACWAHFHWVAFPSHALAGQLNEPNVISSEEIGLNSSDLTRLWLHKSASDLGSAERTSATSFPNCPRMLGIKNLDSCTNALHPSTKSFLFYKLVFSSVHPGATFNAFAPDADEMSTCVSLTALLCDTITTLGP